MLDFNVKMSKTEVKLHIKNKCQEEWDGEVRATLLQYSKERG